MGRLQHRYGETPRRGLKHRRSWGAAIAIVATSSVVVLLAGQAAAVATAPTISIDDVSTPEGGPEGSDHTVSVPIRLSEASPVVVTVNWATADGTADSVDYTAASGVAHFDPGDTLETVDVLIDGGVSPEPDETFTITLSSPVNATIARGVSTVTILNDDVPPPPDPGEVNVIPTGGGGQCVALTEGGGCKPLQAGEQIPINDIAYINPRKSKVLVQSIVGSGSFYGGRFDVAETGTTSAKPVLVLRLVGGSIKAKCSPGSRSLQATGKKPVRRLWGKGKGRFRTRGRYSSGTVRGTNWLTTDFCNGTQTRVVAGVVQVYDLVKKKTILLQPGEQYFAEAGRIN